MTAATLDGLLRDRADAMSDRLAYGFFTDASMETRTYGELDREARRVAVAIADRVAPGGRVVLVYAPGMPFIEAFFGCLYAGVVAVPVVPPLPPRLEVGLAHLATVVADCRAELLCTTDDVVALFEPGLPAGVPVLATDRAPDGGAPTGRRSSGHDIAFLQYTSGSTSQPRGVILRHENLFANEAAIAEGVRMTPESVGVSWLPMYHDMGLIACVLHPLYVGAPMYLMSPLEFLQRPMRWLEAISRFGGTISGGPNFAYELCIKRASDVSNVDLSTWTVAFCGAEPIRASTFDRFVDAFSAHGFRREALYPCYGLAEATVFVTGATFGAGPVVRRVDAECLSAGVAEPAAEGVDVVSSGTTSRHHVVVVVDPATGEPVPDRTIGEIWFAGPSVATGYWRRPEESAATFGHTIAGRDEAFLRTGDLGFLDDGELFVTGRIKEVLIVRGRNVHPHDIEAAAQSADARARAGCGAAFALADEIVLLQETATVERDALAEIAANLRRAVMQDQMVSLDRIVLVPPQTLPKTSSGKMRRTECRRLTAEGAIPSLIEWRNERRRAETASQP